MVDPVDWNRVGQGMQMEQASGEQGISDNKKDKAETNLLCALLLFKHFLLLCHDLVFVFEN